MRSHLTSKKIRSKIKSIAKESKSLIEVILPKKRFVRIIALKEEQISVSEMRLSSLLLQIKHKLPFTHFISIPFNHEVMQNNFNTFRENICKHPSVEQWNINSLLFQNPNKIHLTFGILVLMTDEERTRATRTLQLCQEEVVKPILGDKPLVVDVKGVDVMNRDPNKAHVLYAKIQNTNLLQSIADQVVDRFVKQGLMAKQKDPVKLHVTLMNSLFRLRKGKRRKSLMSECSDGSSEISMKNKKKGRQYFDASEIVQNFSDFTFAENLTLNEIHLSKVSYVDKDGYYAAMEKINL
ncbi:activating signal cointegrator 1 complex subunit 1-like protein [Dinothrombium tinctorium]|uniref:Activating signal cointegrator 1 complex subunit 1-like protein n=1 Tax=Dinothrombium tinctorium TaxID=1965070 RepID=A0A3S3Q6B4_9ACAR|nr:activating signal cointegrator 1 complex subunit 1-like protein [Dinothrombium tinctorium]RWS04231.1 activating signal cointegrator 1 complex subunit 1-like protein [Dinothrombium tinctorium]RWS08753.1 activating signal cointegrator 1 complex subunit 1-like protein [Dinothrombium tinctorium]RWS08762.1 activating signal cointegrator 1 complex subunit 1-like protein [Dinothrombium tinctorium]